MYNRCLKIDYNSQPFAKKVRKRFQKISGGGLTHTVVIEQQH